MRIEDFSSQARKHLRRTLEGYYAYVPPPLPPRVDLKWSLVNQLSEADRAVSRLGGLARTLPNPHLLISPFIHREAVLSSRIEGTQASLWDLFTYEALPLPFDSEKTAATLDVREVHNYGVALAARSAALVKDSIAALPKEYL